MSAIARLTVLLGVLAIALVGSPARAQATSEKQAAAEDLFQRGKARMAEKNFDEACPPARQ